MEQELRDLEDLLNISPQDEDLKLLEEEISQLEKKIKDLEFKTYLSERYDFKNAILAINAGAGGTESCDWVQMLLRMYQRWADKKRFETQILDILPGEEAGIRNVTMLIKGKYAYGYLKAEKGVHRLVRISPFDANRRRHTSFALVEVLPEIEDVEINIDEKDLKIETFRASGPGGQHVNVTDSAVRIRHIPTGIVVQCQNERSQHKNKALALKILRAKLFELEEKKKRKELDRLRVKGKIGWGYQIRSYVLHPYTMVKDHRTELEISNAQAVLDGEIDEFIQAWLKRRN